jgi:hypothetical protein
MIIHSLYPNSLRQLALFSLVGVLNNMFGYLIYLLITWFWLEPKIAVTLMYPLGALTAYFGHSKYSFVNTKSSTSNKITRYVIAHLIGYGVNMGIIYVFSDQLGYPHQLCQAAAILVVAGILFLLLRYFVFPNNPQLS